MMNPYQFSLTCDLCGGGGLGTISAAAAAWDSRSRIYHRDRRVCEENLRRARTTPQPGQGKQEESSG